MRQITTYRVFIAAPSDMSSEVEAVKQLLDDINYLSEPLGFVFDSFYWLDNATPGVDVEAQARIDKQGDGYDVIVSLMGAKIGSPTINHASGTVGEIEKALEQHQSLAFKNDSVICLFKEVLIGIKSPDLQSILEVQKFRDSLGNRGVLFRDFNDDFDLRSVILRSFGIIFYRHVQSNAHPGKVDYISANGVDRAVPEGELSESETTETVSTAVALSNQESREDYGILDFEEIGNENFIYAQNEIESIGYIIKEIGENLPDYTAQLETARSVDDNKAVKNIITKVAVQLDTCADLLEGRDLTIPSLIAKAFSSIISIVEIRKVDSDVTLLAEEKATMAAVLEGLMSSIEEATEAFEGLRTSLLDMPRLTKDLNLAKRRLLAVMDKIIAMQGETHREVGLALAYFTAP